MEQVTGIIEFPDMKDYADLDEWRADIIQVKREELKRVRAETGIKPLSVIRLLAIVKRYSKDNYIISKRSRDHRSFEPTEKQCWKLVQLGLLAFVDRYWTVADLFKWKAGAIPPAYKFEITPHGTEILSHVREWYWYD